MSLKWIKDHKIGVGISLIILVALILILLNLPTLQCGLRLQCGSSIGCWAFCKWGGMELLPSCEQIGGTCKSTCDSRIEDAMAKQGEINCSADLMCCFPKPPNENECPPIPITLICPDCVGDISDCLCPMGVDEQGCAVWRCGLCSIKEQADCYSACVDAGFPFGGYPSERSECSKYCTYLEEGCCCPWAY